MCFNSSYKIKYALSYIKSIYLLSKTKILIVCGTRDGQAIVLYTDDGDKAVNEEIENIKKYLKNIKKEDKQTPSVCNKTLELLSGVRYLIKDATYAYEQEYRLICFANERNISDIVQREDPEKQNEETEDTQEQHPPRIYVETDILPKLCGVLTAPKLSKAQILDIQYSLHRYTQENKLSYLKEQPIHTSTIPYR